MVYIITVVKNRDQLAEEASSYLYDLCKFYGIIAIFAVTEELDIAAQCIRSLCRLYNLSSVLQRRSFGWQVFHDLGLIALRFSLFCRLYKVSTYVYEKVNRPHLLNQLVTSFHIPVIGSSQRSNTLLVIAFCS